MCLTVTLDREDDGRWIAEVAELPGVMAYGETEDDAMTRVKALSLRVMADRLEQREMVPIMDELFSVAS
jgi:predicted RNase H-like HicB family nuclease